MLIGFNDNVALPTIGTVETLICCLFFGVRVSVTFHLTCVHIIFSSVPVAQWPPFGK